MWRIRDRQLAVFEAAGRERFAVSLDDHLREHHELDHWRLGEVEVRRLIQRTLARGPRFGIEHLDDYCRLLSLSVVYGEDFVEKKPWIERTLADPQLGPPIQRFRIVYDLAQVGR